MGHVSGSIGGISAAQFAQRAEAHGFAEPVVQFRLAANLRHWAKVRAKLKVGVLTQGRVAFLGDSKTVGAGCGTGSQFTAGAFAGSRPQRFAALLANAGVPVRADCWFGSAGLGSIADVLAYDSRRSGFAGWTGGNISLGGPALGTANANPGVFTPSAPVNHVSIFFRNGADRPTFTVAKGAESSTIAPSGSAMLTRAEISFPTKDASPISVVRTGGANSLQLVGMSAWDSSKPGIEVANFGVYGVSASYQADVSTAYAPLNALATYAPDLTVVNLGTNDLNGAVPLTSYLASLQSIVTVAKASGDCVVEWPAVGGGSPAYGSDAARQLWRDAVREVARSNGCLFIDEEALLGGRSAAAASGAFADSVHEVGWAYELEAAELASALI